MSDLAYTVAVIKNRHEIWDQLNEHQHLLGEERRQIWEGEQEESSTKKTPKFTKKAGKKREYNASGWNHQGIIFYNKVQDEWKRLASENKDQTWEKLESSGMNILKSTSQCISQAKVVGKGNQTMVPTPKKCPPYCQWMYLR
jgi:hypothetical protein